MAALGRPYLYAALRSGITGSHTDIGDDTRAFLAVCASGGSKVLGGFGIRTGLQAKAVAPHVHAVVAGSVFVEAISAAAAAHPNDRTGRDEAIRQAVRERAMDITEG